MTRHLPEEMRNMFQAGKRCVQERSGTLKINPTLSSNVRWVQCTKFCLAGSHQGQDWEPRAAEKVEGTGNSSPALEAGVLLYRHFPAEGNLYFLNQQPSPGS